MVLLAVLSSCTGHPLEKEPRKLNIGEAVETMISKAESRKHSLQEKYMEMLSSVDMPNARNEIRPRNSIEPRKQSFEDVADKFAEVVEEKEMIMDKLEAMGAEMRSMERRGLDADTEFMIQDYRNNVGGLSIRYKTYVTKELSKCVGSSPRKQKMNRRMNTLYKRFQQQLTEVERVLNHSKQEFTAPKKINMFITPPKHQLQLNTLNTLTFLVDSIDVNVHRAFRDITNVRYFRCPETPMIIEA